MVVDVGLQHAEECEPIYCARALLHVRKKREKRRETSPLTVGFESHRAPARAAWRGSCALRLHSARVWFDVLDYLVRELEVLDFNGASTGLGSDSEVVQMLEP